MTLEELVGADRALALAVKRLDEVLDADPVLKVNARATTAALLLIAGNSMADTPWQFDREKMLAFSKRFLEAGYDVGPER